MPLPTNFSPWEHLQGLLMSLVNRMIREEFSDLDDEIEDITIPRGSLRVACWLKDSDTAVMTLIRMFLFFIIIRKGNIDDLYPLLSSLGMSKNTGPTRKNRPQVTLVFSSNPSDDPSKQIWREVSFRIMDETVNTFTRSKAISLANKIKSNFGTGSGFYWNTGKNMYSYCDWDRGYQFQILGQSDTDVKELIRKVMGLQSHAPNWTYLNTNTNDSPTETYPNTPPMTTIMGETFREPVRRPTGKVYFRYATLSLSPKKPVTLYDKTGRRLDPLID